MSVSRTRPPRSRRTDHAIRVISVYATQWRHSGSAGARTVDFEWGRLSEFYELVRGQLPQVLDHQILDVATLSFPVPGDGDTDLPGLTGAEFWLFALPSDQVVAALTLHLRIPDLTEDPGPTVRALERLAYAYVAIGDRTLPDHIGAAARAAGAAPIDDGLTVLPPERHQIVFAPEIPGRQLPGDEVVERILYRIDPPYRREFMPAVGRPGGLNIEERSLGAITPYVSLLYGHPEYVENSVFLTAVQAVGTAARFRQIWHTAHQLVRTFRATKLAREVGAQRREDLEELVDTLGNLELDLSFSVETSADLGLLIPSLRIASFYRALSDEMELPTRARTVSQMFTRLSGSIRSEITAIEIRERAADEAKRLRGAKAASVVSTVAVPLSFLVTYFGINARQVDGRRSIFDLRFYAFPYLVSAFLAVLPVVVFFLVYGKSLLDARRRRATEGSPRQPPEPVGATGP